MPVEKLSISISAELAAKVRSRAGAGGVSAFTTRSLQRELARQRRDEALDDYLDEMERLYGPVDDAAVEEARNLFRD